MNKPQITYSDDKIVITLENNDESKEIVDSLLAKAEFYELLEQANFDESILDIAKEIKSNAAKKYIQDNNLS
jgi:hypothetical protein